MKISSYQYNKNNIKAANSYRNYTSKFRKNYEVKNFSKKINYFKV